MQTAVMSMDTNTKISKILAVAEHETTGDNEALAAMRRAQAMLKKTGRSLSTLVGPQPMSPDLINTPVAKWMAQIADLKAIIRDRDTEIGALRKEIQGLKAKKSAQTSATPKKVMANADGLYVFNDFRRAVVDHIGRDSGWQTIYCDATGTNMSTIQMWRMKGFVPQEAYDAITAIDMSQVKHSSRQTWTTEELDSLAKLGKAGNIPLATIAKTLSAEFKRHISTNSIKGQLDRLRKRGKV